MWVVVSGDGDIDYLSVFGPFATEEEAEAKLLEDEDDIRWRVCKLEPPSTIFKTHEPSLSGDDAAASGRQFILDSAGITSEELDAWVEANDLIRRFGWDDTVNVPAETYELYKTLSHKLGI